MPFQHSVYIVSTHYADMPHVAPWVFYFDSEHDARTLIAMTRQHEANFNDDAPLIIEMAVYLHSQDLSVS